MSLSRKIGVMIVGAGRKPRVGKNPMEARVMLGISFKPRMERNLWIHGPAEAGHIERACVMRKSLKGGLGCCAFVFSLTLVGGFLFIRHQIISPDSGMPYSERSIIMSDDVKTVSIILRELSMDQTDRTNEWVFWPSTLGLGTCSNSTEFLRRLQREPPIEALFPRMFGDMRTYPHSVASERCFFRENGESRWTILMDPSENTPSFVPLILSSGIDVTVLCDLLSESPPLPRKTHLLKKGDGRGVLHFKDWEVLFLNNQSFEPQKRDRIMKTFGEMSPSYNATYLTPTGLVSVTFRSP